MHARVPLALGLQAMSDLLAIADDGLWHCRERDGGLTAELVRPTRAAQCVAIDVREGRSLYLGTRREGVWKSTDLGRSWARLPLPARDVFSLAVSESDGAVYAGCEPSRLYASADGGGRWRELEALTRLPSAPTWSFPPRPWTSHVSAVAPHPRRAGVLLVGIELGGLMLSEDAGETWCDHRPGAQRDVHALAWHPRRGDRAYQAAGGGACFSTDGGRSWHGADAGRERHYCWGLAVDESEANTWFVSASTGARAAHGERKADAGVYRWRDHGPWEPLTGGLPVPLDDMPYALATHQARLYLGLRSGRLLASDDRGDSWEELRFGGRRPSGVRQLVPLPG